MGELDGRVALVTGAARGMGAASARMLAEAGAKVLVTDILDEPGEQVARAIGEAARFVHLDVASSAEWVFAVDAASEAFGPVTALVNNAGVAAFGGVHEMPPEEFRRVLDVNLVGTFLGMHHVIPGMADAGGGTIVNVSSLAGMAGFAGIGAYTASKWGVRGLTKTAALEVSRRGIRVNSVHPGVIETQMTADADHEALTARQPIPRVGQPEEVAEMVLFLTSDRSSYCTGSEFVIDGGALTGVAALPSQG